jgi:hypothetical protein
MHSSFWLSDAHNPVFFKNIFGFETPHYDQTTLCDGQYPYCRSPYLKVKLFYQYKNMPVKLYLESYIE